MSRGTYKYIILVCVFFSCRKKVEVEYIYNPTYVTLEVPDNFPPLEIPQENPLTEEGILLGRHLFWDTKLSGDNSLACASCHLPQHAFSDPNPLSIGANGHLGKRNAMVLQNLACSRSAKSKTTPFNFAPRRSAPMRIAPQRSAPLKSAFLRLV